MQRLGEKSRLTLSGAGGMSRSKDGESDASGDNALAQITCPVLFVLGAQNQMTQAKAAQPLINKARASGRIVRVASLPVGHHQMTEAPEETLFAMRDFLSG